MYEMLGNQQFLARNYDKAAEYLARAAAKDPGNKGIRRKLIICYTQLGKVDDALSVFLPLVMEDADFIIRTHPVDDDCPCREMVYDMESRTRSTEKSMGEQIILGILWLYCDLEKSIQYFEQAHNTAPENPAVKTVLTILYARFEKERMKKSLNKDH
ncbi:MAG: tetratricopeptide repeat protein [Calditrichia bacterium]